jgi:hypothetical protein
MVVALITVVVVKAVVVVKIVVDVVVVISPCSACLTHPLENTTIAATARSKVNLFIKLYFL